MSELVKLNPAEFGIEESKATQIAEQFKPMLDKMVELEAEYNEVMSERSEKGHTKDIASKAKALRLKYVKVRTGTAAIHKEQKAFYLAAGRFIDGWKNAQLFASEGIEKKLQDIEDYEINLEKQRIEKLRLERTEIALQYGVDTTTVALGLMEDAVWENFIQGAKLAFEAKKKAEKEAEEARIAAEKKAEEEREAQRLENERLKKEAEEREEAARVERERMAAELQAERDRAEKVRKEAEEQARKEREAAEAKLAEERRANEEKLRKEAEEKAKLEAELKAKKEAEEKAEKDRLEAERLERLKGDKEKFSDLISDIKTLGEKYTFENLESVALYAEVNTLFSKVIAHIEAKSK